MITELPAKVSLVEIRAIFVCSRARRRQSRFGVDFSRLGPRPSEKATRITRKVSCSLRPRRSSSSSSLSLLRSSPVHFCAPLPPAEFQRPSKIHRVIGRFSDAIDPILRREGRRFPPFPPDFRPDPRDRCSFDPFSISEARFLANHSPQLPPAFFLLFFLFLLLLLLLFLTPSLLLLWCVALFYF